jgi:hypothetical protein
MFGKILAHMHPFDWRETHVPVDDAPAPFAFREEDTIRRFFQCSQSAPGPILLLGSEGELPLHQHSFSEPQPSEWQKWFPGLGLSRTQTAKPKCVETIWYFLHMRVAK